MRQWPFALILGFALDLIFGDPVWLYHPVRLIGGLIGRVERVSRRIFPARDRGETAAGVFFALTVIIIATGLPLLILRGAQAVNPWLSFVLCVFWDYQLLAVKSLRTESMKVYDALKSGDLEGGRYAVSMIVGRDTQRLSGEGVAKAAVETVAENTSDGVIAPMLFLAFLGPAAGFFYKAVNTMDSMAGYKNDRYLYFGRFCARLDDAVNLIPARISGLLMVLASLPAGFDMKNSWRIYRRDRRNHASPNSAHTEAAAAGALHIRLAGDAYYFGKLCKKKTIGDADRPVEYEDIPRVNRLLYVAAFLGCALFFGASFLIYG